MGLAILLRTGARVRFGRTGKTEVALHRAVHLARTNPDSRVLLTTFPEAARKGRGARYFSGLLKRSGNSNYELGSRTLTLASSFDRCVVQLNQVLDYRQSYA
jgi:hypothetical protein